MNRITSFTKQQIDKEAVRAHAHDRFGVRINVPAPERYVVHKLIISRMSTETPSNQVKAPKDLFACRTLIGVLLVNRPYGLQDVWIDVLQRRRKWESKIMQSVNLLKPNIREKLLGRTE